MKFTILTIFMLFISTAAIADDAIIKYFDQVEDLLIRIDSGISLNSFAETIADMKIKSKNAQKNTGGFDNLLLRDRIKEFSQLLDDYNRIWKYQETDKFKFMGPNDPIIGRYQTGGCQITTLTVDIKYDISCIKNVIFNEMKPKAEKAKSAHFNGW